MVAVRTVPPKFTKELAEKTLTLPVGGSTAVELPFAASPQPKVTWTFNGGKLPDPKRFKTDTISAMTSLTMAKVVRKDAGKYAVAIENELGKCELAVTLIVLGEIARLSHSIDLFVDHERRQDFLCRGGQSGGKAEGLGGQRKIDTVEH